MRIVFMGTTEFSCVVLQQLIDDDYEIVAVITQPDRPYGRKKELKMPPVKVLAAKYGIPVLQPEKIKEAEAELRAYRPDVMVTCAYGQIVPKAILEIPKYKPVNIHTSLLPKYRGGAPIHWAVICGEPATGVSLMIMDVGMDSGAVLAQEKVSISKTDMMSDVELKLMDASRILMHHAFPKYLEGKLPLIEQDPEQVSYAYAIKREEEWIGFDRDTETVYNHIRGLISWPVGYALLEGQRVKFHGVRFGEITGTDHAGQILEVRENGVEIGTADGSVIITQIQPSGRPVMSAKDFMNGMGRAWKGKIFNES